MTSWAGVPVAIVVATAGSWLIVRTSLGHRLIDRPTFRSLHDRPIPRGGGVAVSLGVVAGALASQLWRAAPFGPGDFDLGWLLGAFGVLVMLGIADDRSGLPARVRLAVQTIAVFAYLLAVHAAPSSVVLFGREMALGIFAIPMAGAVTLWMLNLYNFMDGMDGFAGLMTVVGFGTMSWLAARGGHDGLLLAGAVTAAAALGFLIWNLPPARLFLGDSGSVPLGFLASALALSGVQVGAWSPVVPAILFAPFILDATATLLRRLLRGERVWVAHRTHVYQRLVVAGFGHRKTLAIEAVFMIAAAALACGAHRRGAAAEAAAAGAVIAMYGALFLAATRLSRPGSAAAL